MTWVRIVKRLCLFCLVNLFVMTTFFPYYYSTRFEREELHSREFRNRRRVFFSLLVSLSRSCAMGVWNCVAYVKMYVSACLTSY